MAKIINTNLRKLLNGYVYTYTGLLSRHTVCGKDVWLNPSFQRNFSLYTSSFIRVHFPSKQQKRSLSQNPKINLHVSGIKLRCSSGFHTSQRYQAPPVIFLAIIKPVAKVASIIGGRFFRNRWNKLSDEEKAQIKKKYGFTKGRLAAAFGLLIAAGLLEYFTHIQEAPITGRKRFISLTKEQVNLISEAELQEFIEANKQLIVHADHPFYQRIINVTQRIVDANQDIDFIRDQKWRILVIDDANINAFVLPTGDIVVHTGLLEIASNDDQLAVIIGHEMAHAVLSHGAEKLSLAGVLDWIVIVIMAGIWCFMPGDGIALVTQWFYHRVIDLLLHLPYSRLLETEADDVGLHLIAKACFDVRESSNFWGHMAFREEIDGSVPEWLSTHPANDTRESFLDLLIPQAIDTRTCQKCPPLRSADPREEMKLVRALLDQKKWENEEEKRLEEEESLAGVVQKGANTARAASAGSGAIRASLRVTTATSGATSVIAGATVGATYDARSETFGKTYDNTSATSGATSVSSGPLETKEASTELATVAATPNDARDETSASLNTLAAGSASFEATSGCDKSADSCSHDCTTNSPSTEKS